MTKRKRFLPDLMEPLASISNAEGVSSGAALLRPGSGGRCPPALGPVRTGDPRGPRQAARLPPPLPQGEGSTSHSPRLLRAELPLPRLLCRAFSPVGKSRVSFLTGHRGSPSWNCPFTFCDPAQTQKLS